MRTTGGYIRTTRVFIHMYKLRLHTYVVERGPRDREKVGSIQQRTR